MNFEVVDSKTGVPTLKKGETWLHSKYDPIKEAAREVEAALVHSPTMLVVLGMGLGYVIDEALEQTDTMKILVIERDKAIFDLASSSRDLPSDPRVEYVLGSDEDANFETITAFIDDVSATTLAFISRLANEDPEYYKSVAETIGHVAEMLMEGLKSTAQFGELWWKNAVSNYRFYAGAPDIGAWYGKFEDQPVFVFAAGPSLDDHIDKFVGVDGGIRFVVDTAYSLLESKGVRIDAVFAIDAQDRTLDHFDGLRTDKLIATPIVPPALIEKAPRSLLMSLAGPMFDWFEAAMGCERSRLKSGGSVTTFAFDLARKIGSRDVIFVGADFAYRSGRRYAGSTIYDQSRLGATSRFFSLEDNSFQTIDVPGVSEKGEKTDTNLVQYSRWLEWEIANSQGSFEKMGEFGVLDVPSALPERIDELLKRSAPDLKWNEMNIDDADNNKRVEKLSQSMAQEKEKLDKIRNGSISDLANLSGFFDPLYRPEAVMSRTGSLSEEAKERLYLKLDRASLHLEETLDEQRQ